MALTPRGRVKTDDLEHVVMANNKTIAVGEAVKTDSSGFITNGGAAAPLLGICIGFDTATSASLTPTEYAAGTETSTDVTSVTTAGDNQTAAKKRAIVCTDRNQKWSAEVSGNLGDSNASDQFGCRIDIDSSNSNYARLLEGTADRTAGSTRNFFSYGPDSADDTRLVVSIACSEKVVEQS